MGQPTIFSHSNVLATIRERDWIAKTHCRPPMMTGGDLSIVRITDRELAQGPITRSDK